MVDDHDTCIDIRNIVMVNGELRQSNQFAKHTNIEQEKDKDEELAKEPDIGNEAETTTHTKTQHMKQARLISNLLLTELRL
eukprot:3514811-Heterocapsa_arctica.AAC.1